MWVTACTAAKGSMQHVTTATCKLIDLHMLFQAGNAGMISIQDNQHSGVRMTVIARLVACV